MARLREQRHVDGTACYWCPRCRRWWPVDHFTRADKLYSGCRVDTDPLYRRCPECSAPAGVPCMSVDLEEVKTHARRSA